MRIVYLDHERRIKLYDEGGTAQERYIHVDGFPREENWIVVDDKNWLPDLQKLAVSVNMALQCAL